MGIIFIGCLLVLAANALGAGKKNNDFMSRDMTSTINGYFLTTVFMTHFIQYLSADSYNGLDWMYIYINRALGQLIVAMFLFYSGYGVMESIKNKEGYIRTFPVKRILLLALDFEIAALIYLGVSCLTNNTHTFRYAIKAFFAWESLGNSNWYVFAIMYLYIVTYLSFCLNHSRNIGISLILVVLFTVFYMYFMAQHKGGWWYDTVMCYPAGMLFSWQLNKARAYFGRGWKYGIGLLVLVCSFCGVYVFRKENVWFFELLAVLFALIVVMLTARFKATGRLYGYIGKNLFCFYIYQRVPMILFKDILGKQNIYLYFFICVLATALIGMIMIKVYGWLHKKYMAFFQKYLPELIG